MRDFLGPAFKIVIAFVIAAAVINEIGSLIWAQYQSGEIAKTIAEGAATQYRANHSQPMAGQAAVAIAADRGVTVYGFEIKYGQLTVWVKVPPVRTPLVAFLQWLGGYWGTAKGWSQSMTSALTVDTKYTTEVPKV